MDRKLWKLSLHEKRAPRWPCPACHKSTLRLDRATVTVVETRESKLARYRDDWAEIDIIERFMCLLVCDHKTCGEPVVVLGNTSYEPVPGPDDDYSWERDLNPLLFNPTLRIIQIPVACPADVRSEIEGAFSLYWLDAASAANRIRVAVERLLTHLKIKRYDRSTRRRLNLHKRIELFRARNSELGRSMLAVKWIGNEGSHPGRLNRDDLLDAFELMEYVLDEIYNDKRSKLAKISREILRRKGPRSAPHRKKRRLRVV